MVLSVGSRRFFFLNFPIFVLMAIFYCGGCCCGWAAVGSEVMMLVINMALRIAPERAASLQRVAFALQVLHGCLLLLAPLRPRL